MSGIERLVAWGLLFVAWGAAAAGSEGKSFRATSEYALRVGDQRIAEAEVFYSPRQVAYLVISDRLDRPLIVRIPEETVASIPATAVELDEVEGLARLATASRERHLGEIERRLKEIRFQLGGEPAALIPAPPIVGWHTPHTIRSRDLVLRSGFARAKRNAPETKALDLPPHQELLIEVFFGSWDEYSQTVMPKIMQLEEELASGTVRFLYYGLPRRIADDPTGVERSIGGVPTLIVSVDGAELGRLAGRALYQPSESLSRLLNGEQD